jgi:outer membrane protein OmpA-like peptidoglycan-associated protein
MAFGAELTLGYRLRASRRVSFFPQLQVNYMFTPIAENAPWNLLQATPQIGIGYELSPDPEPVSVPPPPVQPPDTPVVRKPVLVAHVVAKGVDAAGREYDDPAIEIEEAPWVEVVPLLPAVFFDSAGVDIPHRYTLLESPASASRFSIDSIVNVSPIDIHWQILNIIGGRLRADSRIVATIVGTGSADENAEGNGLATARAESVARYLRSVWGIDSSRLRIVTSPRPAAPSNEERQEGREENRRVEFRFSRTSATDPVLIHRLARVASPPAVKFNTDITADADLADWNVTVVQGEKVLLRFEGSSGAGSLTQSQLWPLTDLRVNRDLAPIRYRLEVTDVLGQEASDSGIFRVTERVKQVGGDSSNRQVELYGYNVVGFDYDSAELLPRQLSELTGIARSASGQAQMTIVGYTDRVGDPERNRLLSLARAQAVRDAIRAEQRRLNLPEALSISVQGAGQQKDLFDNDLPEGRILSRMAIVTITKLRSK